MERPWTSSTSPSVRTVHFAPFSPWTDLESKLVESMGENRSLNAVICVAGGFSGGSVNAKSFLKSVTSSIEQSIWTSTIASRLAHKYMNTDGLLVLTGSAGALEPGPKSVGYSLAKAAVHSMTKSLADKDSPLAGDVVAILPTTIDTEMNRQWMKDADFSTWTPCEWISDLLSKWCSEPDSRPVSGSLVKLVTANGISKTEIVQD